jgi:hypothetical protein
LVDSSAKRNGSSKPDFDVPAKLDTRINAQFSRGVRLTGVAVPGAAAYPAASA